MASKKKEDEVVPDLPQFVLIIYSVVLVGIIFYGLYRIPFGGPITGEEYSFAVPVVISWIVTLAFIQMFIEFLKVCHRHAQLTRFRRCQSFLLMSTGLCAFFGFVPRVVVFFNQEWFMWYSIYVSLFGIVVSFCHYASFHSEVCKIIRSWTDGCSWKLFLTQLAFMVALFYYLDKSKHFNDSHSAAIFICHLGFSFVCAVATIDFCYLWRGMIMMNLHLNDEHQKAAAEFYGLPVIHDGQSEELESVFICEVCNKNYNQTNQTPRMLKECGHTICEECGDKMLKKNNEQFLNCPQCKMVTLVHGPAALLPKNAIVMDSMAPKNIKNPVEVV
ncbi:hypothetical protein CAEBREN_14922 [Caenorhabditis brenneri]|uniref:RING-type domain-containing protein n=1 Tax=Caenorhabditis brenneri TaxID=135651 RepID=G0N825_CAEBE|nr:hypothetical protein CAEBREN_14922 [Caenorhabditis brenneri]